jgi:hypothetical protein
VPEAGHLAGTERPELVATTAERFLGHSA